LSAVVLGSSNFLVPNATFFVELAAFLIVLFVLGRYVLPYINKPLSERQATIRQALVDAEEAKRRAAEAEEEYRRAITEARSQARAVVEEANRLAEQMRAEKRQQADREYEMVLGRARADIDAQVRQATEALRQQVGDLAVSVVEKVLGDGLAPDAHQSLIDRTIAEVEARADATGVRS
jgi:F-type H+-transporting ATPase subunit b